MLQLDYYFFITAVTNYHKLCDLQESSFTTWQLEVRNPKSVMGCRSHGVSRPDTSWRLKKQPLLCLFQHLESEGILWPMACSLLHLPSASFLPYLLLTLPLLAPSYKVPGNYMSPSVWFRVTAPSLEPQLITAARFLFCCKIISISSRIKAWASLGSGGEHNAT